MDRRTKNKWEQHYCFAGVRTFFFCPTCCADILSIRLDRWRANKKYSIEYGTIIFNGHVWGSMCACVCPLCNTDHYTILFIRCHCPHVTEESVSLERQKYIAMLICRDWGCSVETAHYIPGRINQCPWTGSKGRCKRAPDQIQIGTQRVKFENSSSLLNRLIS